jgi:hypothetical protein
MASWCWEALQQFRSPSPSQSGRSGRVTPVCLHAFAQSRLMGPTLTGTKEVGVKKQPLKIGICINPQPWPSPARGRTPVAVQWRTRSLDGEQRVARQCRLSARLLFARPLLLFLLIPPASSFVSYLALLPLPIPTHIHKHTTSSERCLLSFSLPQSHYHPHASL